MQALALGNVQHASDILDANEAARKHEPHFHLGAGLVAAARGQMPDAVESLRASLAIDPAVAETQLQLAAVLAAQGRFIDAGGPAALARRLGDVDDPRAAYLQGLLQLNARLTEAAKLSLASAAKAKGPFAQSADALGKRLSEQTLQKQEKRKELLAAAEEAAKRATTARQELARARAALAALADEAQRLINNADLLYRQACAAADAQFDLDMAGHKPADADYDAVRQAATRKREIAKGQAATIRQQAVLGVNQSYQQPVALAQTAIETAQRAATDADTALAQAGSRLATLDRAAEAPLLTSAELTAEFGKIIASGPAAVVGSSPAASQTKPAP
jgi:chromosome segregation ATPase